MNGRKCAVVVWVVDTGSGGGMRGKKSILPPSARFSSWTGRGRKHEWDRCEFGRGGGGVGRETWWSDGGWGLSFSDSGFYCPVCSGRGGKGGGWHRLGKRGEIAGEEHEEEEEVAVSKTGANVKIDGTKGGKWHPFHLPKDARKSTMARLSRREKKSRPRSIEGSTLISHLFSKKKGENPAVVAFTSLIVNPSTSSSPSLSSFGRREGDFTSHFSPHRHFPF